MKMIKIRSVVLNTLKMELRLPDDKVEAFIDLLLSASQRKRLSLKELQRIEGKLNWATQIVLTGRPYLRIIFDIMKPLTRRSHKCTMSAELHTAMQVWIVLLRRSNGKHLLVDVQYWQDNGSNVNKKLFNNTVLDLDKVLNIIKIVLCLAIS